MTRGFGVEGKALSVVAKGINSALKLDPPRGARALGHPAQVRVPDIAGTQRVLREQVQDVGEQQFLVLLFVVDAKLNQFKGLIRQRAKLQLFLQKMVDVLAIGVDFTQCRAGQKTT
jgi:hypothetical protein